jgi:hypothetical protein
MSIKKVKVSFVALVVASASLIAISSATTATAATGWCSGVKIAAYPGGPQGGAFANNVYNGYKQAAEDLGADVKYYFSDWDSNKLIQQMKEGLATNPDGMAIYGFGGAAATKPIVVEAFKKGTIVTSLNSELTDLQKIYATKVPRFGEVWWFYPRGDSTECNDAIIYNIRENCWYDAGLSTGSRRSAGYFSQVFHYPINMDWDINTEGYITSNPTISNAGSSYTNGTYTNVALTGSATGTGATANIVVAGGIVTSVTMFNHGSGYLANDILTQEIAVVTGSVSGTVMTVTAIASGTLYVGQYVTGSGISASSRISAFSSGSGGVGTYILDTISSSTGSITITSKFIPAGSNFELNLASSDIQNLVSLYQNEIGTDAIVGNEPIALQSNFETNNLGWVSGGPAQVSAEGANYWLRLERVEPDFIQSGEMNLYVTGRPFAQSQDVTTGPYVFDQDTGKIDMREQRRELRLKFESNVVGGDYQLGYLLLSADIGDVRP